MNTLMITGIAKNIGKATRNGVEFKVEYDVYIWGSLSGNPLQLVTTMKVETEGHATLWEKAKVIGMAYFDGNKMDDGAYTNFLEHLTVIS